jgi:hypothetical protein
MDPAVRGIVINRGFDREEVFYERAWSKRGKGK